MIFKKKKKKTFLSDRLNEKLSRINDEQEDCSVSARHTVLLVDNVFYES